MAEVQIPWGVALVIDDDWNRDTCLCLARDFLSANMNEKSAQVALHARGLGHGIEISYDDWLGVYDASFAILFAKTFSVKRARDLEAEYISREDELGMQSAEIMKGIAVNETFNLGHALDTYVEAALGHTMDQTMQLICNVFRADIHRYLLVCVQDQPIGDLNRTNCDGRIRRFFTNAERSSRQVASSHVVGMFYNHRYTCFLAEHVHKRKEARDQLTALNLHYINEETLSFRERILVDKMKKDVETWSSPTPKKRKRR